MLGKSFHRPEAFPTLSADKLIYQSSFMLKSCSAIEFASLLRRIIRGHADERLAISVLLRWGDKRCPMARYYFHIENGADLIKDEGGKSARTR